MRLDILIVFVYNVAKSRKTTYKSCLQAAPPALAGHLQVQLIECSVGNSYSYAYREMLKDPITWCHIVYSWLGTAYFHKNMLREAS